MININSNCRKIFRNAALLAGAITLPVAGYPVYLALSRQRHFINTSWDTIVLGLLMVVGLALIRRLSWGRMIRLAIGAIYLVVMPFALFVLAVNFVCAYFGDCL